MNSKNWFLAKHLFNRCLWKQKISTKTLLIIFIHSDSPLRSQLTLWIRSLPDAAKRFFSFNAKNFSRRNLKHKLKFSQHLYASEMIYLKCGFCFTLKSELHKRRKSKNVHFMILIHFILAESKTVCCSMFLTGKCH